MSVERFEEIEKIFDSLYETWKPVRKETFAALGKKTAFHIIDFHGNNWIDITKWIFSKYNREEEMNIVFTEFLRVFKEIYWLQFTQRPEIARCFRLATNLCSRSRAFLREDSTDSSSSMIAPHSSQTRWW